MKRVIYFLFLVITCCSMYAQHLPFQGKLLENGQPANGSKTFHFIISNGGVNWSETQSVQVNNGLYAVVLGSVSALPTSLFSQQVSLNLVVQVNGNTLDTVQIFPPIEADPTVPSNLKDGVQWSDIQNLPTLDYSSTNELQNLSIAGNMLTISQGNSITLPAVPDTIPDNVIIDGGLQVGIPETNNISGPGQQQGTTYLLEDTVWQSFVALNTGNITSVQLKFFNPLAIPVKFRIFEGTGTSGQPMFDVTFPANSFPVNQMQTLPVNSTLLLNCGETYTFQVFGVGNSFWVYQSTVNSYAEGISNFGASIDLIFNIFQDVVSNVGMFVNSSGNVGIGTQTPMAKLEIQNQSCTTSADYLKISSTQNQEILTVKNNGNVGIGTANPTKQLDVTGESKFTGNVEVTGITDITGNLNVNGNITINGSLYPSSLLQSNYQFFTSNGIFYVPQGITTLFVTLVGGGGGGGTSIMGGVSGGGGEAVIKYPVSVSSGQSINITVGVGGNGAEIGSWPTAGGNSSLGNLLIVEGGYAAGAFSSNYPNGLGGGSRVLKGSNGTQNKGGSSAFGIGGDSAYYGNPPLGYGAGGGMVGGPNSNGTPGFVLVEW
ncbi:MAG: hypothetical protein K9H64_21950 [Bacteroidales bacterium]|nr:hypothetical protein [Bacteroidales bacterium]